MLSTSKGRSRQCEVLLHFSEYANLPGHNIITSFFWVPPLWGRLPEPAQKYRLIINVHNA